MKKTKGMLISYLIFMLFLTACVNPSNTASSQVAESTNLSPVVDDLTSQKKKIKLAILLDTSSSMDGLIDQAKGQLWKFVNQISKLRYQGEEPELEIAIYQYGNNELSSKSNFIQQMCGFSGSLDDVSEKLFALQTNGGQEYCGHTIIRSLEDLSWDKDAGDLQIIFIAGNEPFNQEPREGSYLRKSASGDAKISYVKAAELATLTDVFVNTIHCGSFEQGVETLWKHGASLTGGAYMAIDHNAQTVYIESPYDDELLTMNQKMNATYLAYGVHGHSDKTKQEEQDVAASRMSKENMVDRTISKSKGVYKNSSWDLVDAQKKKDFDLAKLKGNELPEEMRSMTIAEQKQFLDKKEKEREKIKKDIAELERKRMEYIATVKSQQGADEDKQLDAAMIKALMEQAKRKGFDLLEEQG